MQSRIVNTSNAEQESQYQQWRAGKSISAMEREQDDPTKQACKSTTIMHDVCLCLMTCLMCLMSLRTPMCEQSPQLLSPLHIPHHACHTCTCPAHSTPCMPHLHVPCTVWQVTRDRAMQELEAQHPGYGFGQHKGYGVPAHKAAIQRLGPCEVHRR
jgi:hypothetical protein